MILSRNLPTSLNSKEKMLPGLFFLSGISGLIYQVVWMRMLIRVFGISLYAISTIAAVFMGGLALGSWIAGRALARERASLILYALLEGAIGVSAIITSIAMKGLPVFYASVASHWYDAGAGPSHFALGTIRFLLAGLALAAPTILMGATLPVLGHYLTAHNRRVGKSLAMLYGANTVGAVAGVLLTGFVSLAIVGESGSIAIGVGINFSVAILAYLIQRHSPCVKSQEEALPPSLSKGDSPRFFLIVGAVTGFCALSLEVLWSRLAIFLAGSSVYAFSSVLSVYLLGIGAGSLVATRVIDDLKRPARVLGMLQVGIAAAGLLSLYVFWKLGTVFSDLQFLYSPLYSAMDLFRFFWSSSLILFLATFLMGISFPLLGRLTTRDRDGFAESVGALYAWNTVGGVAGCLVTGYLLIPAIGTQASVCVIAFASLILGSALLLREGPRNMKTFLFLSAMSAGFLLAMPAKTNIVLDVLERRFAHYADSYRILFHREEPAGMLTGVEVRQGTLLLINGIITSGNGIPGHVMAHLPLLLHAGPKNAAVVCFGVGNTFRAAVDHVGDVDAVELMPGVVQSFRDFYPESETYLKSPNARIFVEDGRQHLLMTNKHYDVIVVDASPPIFSAGTVNLYTTDFLEIARRRLRPGGILCLWVPTPCFEDDFWRIAKGFSSVYPHVLAWGKKGMAGVMLMGSTSDLAGSFSHVGERLKTRSLGESAAWLTPDFLASAVLLSDEEIRKRAARYKTVTDDRPLTEFPLWNFLTGRKFWASNDFLLQP